MDRSAISIITVVYNAVLTLEATIKSVISQQTELFEYWIIDGGSTDGSINIIKKYEHQLKGWVSQPDEGVYDAMNKGISCSSGDWIYFLGADDTLQSDILKQIYPYLTPSYKIIYGDVLLDNNQVYHSSLSTRTLLQNTLHHQSAFYHRSLFSEFKYDPRLHIQADYELNLRVYTSRLPTKYVPLLIAKYALGGISGGHNEKSLGEINTIRARTLRKPWQNMFFTVVLRLYYMQKQIRFWLYGHQV